MADAPTVYDAMRLLAEAERFSLWHAKVYFEWEISQDVVDSFIGKWGYPASHNVDEFLGVSAKIVDEPNTLRLVPRNG